MCRNILKVIGITIIVGLPIYLFFPPLVPKYQQKCVDLLGKKYILTVQNNSSFAENDPFYICIKETAKLYVERDFPEIKDLCKAFLTIIVAVFVASITFSEKIVDFSNSGKSHKGVMIGCWIMLLISIVYCGVGLSLMTFAFGIAVHIPYRDYISLENNAAFLFIISGIYFSIALLLLLIAAGISLTKRRQTEPVNSI